MSLSDCSIGDLFKIEKIDTENNYKKRLQSIGFVKGSIVKVILKSEQDYIVNILGSNVAINGTISPLIKGSIIKNNFRKLTIKK